MTFYQGKFRLELSETWGILETNPGNGLTDLNVMGMNYVEMKDGIYFPKRAKWIPGTSLKGSLRHVAITLDPNSCGQVHTSEGRPKCTRNIRCKVCSIFGNYNSEGKLRISSEFIEDGNTVIQPHLTVKRSNKSASTGGLFHTEKMSPSNFTIDIEARDLTEDELKLIRASLKIWGNFGIGRNHKMFTVVPVEELSKVKKEEYFS